MGNATTSKRFTRSGVFLARIRAGTHVRALAVVDALQARDAARLQAIDRRRRGVGRVGACIAARAAREHAADVGA